MPLALLLPMIASLLGQGAKMFFDDDDRMSKIADIAAGALRRVPSMIEAVKNLFDNDPDRVLTVADFDALIASNRAEVAEANLHHQEALERDGKA
jgi:hypothetical protein